MKIYADNAATTKMCPAAIEAMLPFLDRIYGNPSSLHSVGQEAAEALASATRSEVVQVIGTKFILYRQSQKKDKKDRIALVKDKRA